MLKTEKSAKIDSVGRVVIPKGIRNALDLVPDTVVEVLLDGKRVIISRAENVAASREHLHNELEIILDNYRHIPLVTGKVKCAHAIIDEIFSTLTLPTAKAGGFSVQRPLPQSGLTRSPRA